MRAKSENLTCRNLTKKIKCLLRKACHVICLNAGCLWVTRMPSPSAFSKFVLSVRKFLGILKFLSYTQNHFGILKN